MKRLVLFGIVIFLVIIGGFLIVDKLYLHKIFIEKPGSCLVLSESNCKKVKILEINGEQKAVAKLPKNSVLFSPINGTYNNEVAVHGDDEFNTKKWDYGINIESIDSDNTTTYNFIYSKINVIKNNDKNNIEKGKQFGVVNNTKLNYFNDYNFVLNLYYTDKDLNIVENNEDLLKLFNNK